MRLRPSSFNGYSLNSKDTITSWFEEVFSWGLSSASANLAERADTFPSFSSKTLSPKNFSIHIVVKNCVPEKRNELTRYLDTRNLIPQDFYAIDDDTGEKWFSNCHIINLVPEDSLGKKWVATFIMADPTWYSDRLYSDNFSVVSAGSPPVVTGTPRTIMVSAGNLDVIPVIKITPNVQASTDTNSYVRYVDIVNNSPYNLVNYPIDITNGGIDTATLITAGKIHHDGTANKHINNDIKVTDSSKTEINRWMDAASFNTSSTKIWCNVSVKPKVTFQLNGTISNVGTVSTIGIKTPYKISGGRKYYYMAALPTSGIIKIDNEDFSYNTVDITRGFFYNCVRAERGTSAASHSPNATITFIEVPLQINYGSDVYTDIVVDKPDYDNTKPLLNLATATNTSFIYSKFGSDTGKRTGGLSSQIFVGVKDRTVGIYSTRTGTDIYGANIGIDEPYSFAGYFAKANEYISTTTRFYPTNANLGLMIENPCGITTVDASGYKYRKNFTSTGNWTAYTGLWKKYGTQWLVQYLLGSPASNDTATAWTQNSSALGATYYTIAFINYGYLYGLGTPGYPDSAALEIRTLTLTLDNTKTPTVTISGESASGQVYSMALTITNTTTDEAITITLPTIVSNTIVVDQNYGINNKRAAYIETTGENVLSSISSDTTRLYYMRLVQGANVIEIDEDNIQDVDIEFEWRARNN